MVLSNTLMTSSFLANNGVGSQKDSSSMKRSVHKIIVMYFISDFWFSIASAIALR